MEALGLKPAYICITLTARPALLLRHCKPETCACRCRHPALGACISAAADPAAAQLEHAWPAQRYFSHPAATGLPAGGRAAFIRRQEHVRPRQQSPATAAALPQHSGLLAALAHQQRSGRGVHYFSNPRWCVKCTILSTGAIVAASAINSLQ